MNADKARASLEAILEHSLFHSEAELLAEHDAIIGGKGTRIIIWNLRRWVSSIVNLGASHTCLLYFWLWMQNICKAWAVLIVYFKFIFFFSHTKGWEGSWYTLGFRFLQAKKQGALISFDFPKKLPFHWQPDSLLIFPLEWPFLFFPVPFTPRCIINTSGVPFVQGEVKDERHKQLLSRVEDNWVVGNPLGANSGNLVAFRHHSNNGNQPVKEPGPIRPTRETSHDHEIGSGLQ